MSGSASAYLDAVKLLGRRELSERQVRQRLARKGHPDAEVDAAVDRLKADRAIDDRRTAGAIARTETLVRRRGRTRVRRALEQAGIAPDLIRAAIDDAFAEIDEETAVETALRRRLPGDRPIADAREFQRLYRYLLAQGFEPAGVLRALRSRRGTGPDLVPEDLP